MSLDWIKQEDTGVHELDEGILVWSNPSIDIVLTSEGVVLSASTGLPRNKLTENRANQDYFGVNIRKDKTCTLKASNASFSSLYSRVVLGKPLTSGKIMQRIDKTKGYLPDNVQITLARFPDLDYTTKTDDNTFKSTPKAADKPLAWMQKQSQTQQEIFELKGTNLCEDGVLAIEKEENTNSETATEKFYTITKGTQSFRTEDFAIFPTLELANWHQSNISKGKGNAQIVLDFNGGWQLAEEIYFQEVKYNKKKPYENFCDVIANNNGVVDISEQDTASFKEAKDLFKKQGINTTYVSTSLYREVYTLEQAEVIQQKLEKYCVEAKAYEEALSKIKKATRELNEEVYK